MPNFADCKTWLDEARPLLGMSDAKKMGKRTDEIGALLRTMKATLEPPENQVFQSEAQANAFREQLVRLLDEFEGQAQLAKISNSKSDVKEISLKLRQIKQKARLALGKVRPTANDKVKQQLLNSSRNEPVYRDLRKQMIEAIEELKQLPGTRNQRNKLAGMLNAAKACLPDYSQAVQNLTFPDDEDEVPGEGLRLLMEEARQASKELPEKVFQGEAFTLLYRSAETLLGEYAKVAPLSDHETVDRYRKSVPKILADAERNKDEPVAVAAIQKAIDELTKLKNDCAAAQQKIEGPKEYVKLKWPEVEKTVPFRQVAILKADKERAESLESCQLYKEAAKAYEKLDAKIEATFKITLEAPAQWKGLQTEIAEMEEILREAESVRALQTAMNRLRTVIVKARAAATKDQDFVAACAKIESIRKDVEAVKHGTQEFNVKSVDGAPPTVKFANAYRTVEVKMQAYTTTVETLIQDVEKGEIALLVKEGGDPAPFRAEAGQIRKDLSRALAMHAKWFEENYEHAYTAGSRENVLQEFSEGIDREYRGPVVQRVNALSDEVMQTLHDGPRLDRSKQQAILGKNKESSLAAIKKLEKLMDEFEILGLPDDHAGMVQLQKVRAALPDLKSRAANGEHINEMAELHSDELKKQQEKIEADIERRRQDSERRANQLNEKIDKLEKEDPKYQAYFTSLRTEVAVAASKLSSKVTAVNAKGEASLKAIETKVLEVKDTMKDHSKNYTPVDQKVKFLRQQVDFIKPKDPLEHAKVEHALEALIPGIRKLHPKEALEKLQEFENGQLDTARKAAQKSDEAQKQFKTDATAFKNNLNDTDLQKTAPSLYKSLMARREAAKSAAAGNLDFARNELATLQLLMDTAKDDADKAKRLNTNMEEEEFDGKRRKQEYLAAREIFENNFEPKADAAREDRPDEYEAMKRMVRQADKMTKATPADYAGARQSLDRAVEMAKFLAENPDDDTAPRGRSLRKLNVVWKNRVSTYLKQVTDLISQLDNSTDPADQPIDTAKAHKALTPLLSQFDPRAFDKYFETLSRAKPKLALNERRKTKEAALVRIRRFQAKLKTNSVLLHVAGNPISDVPLRPLRDVLKGMEAEVLGS